MSKLQVIDNSTMNLLIEFDSEEFGDLQDLIEYIFSRIPFSLLMTT
ncbi:hypothetical protein [Bacillus litorisediminis]|nr:hypothetical protein [Bacillus litorisediminis]